MKNSNFPQIIVVKIGTSSVTLEDGKIDRININKIVAQIYALSLRGSKVVLISSGAIKVGMGILGIKERPKDIPHLQACSATGQSYLMEVYNDIFENYGLFASQILLTYDDFRSRKRYLNLRNTFNVLMEMGCIPIVNENDTVSTDETKFGENDTLASLVATGINADLLINLSDVDGLYTKDPSKNKDAKRIPVVEEITSEIVKLGGKSSSGVGSGGMASKIKAAKIAVSSGTGFVIANSKDENVIYKCALGDDVGTFFKGLSHNYTGKQTWLAFASKTKGIITVNCPAREKLISGKSLLPVGVLTVEGSFGVGDTVSISCEGKIFAKGITYYSSKDVLKIAGKKTNQIEKILGKNDYEEVVHHNNMVIL